MQDCLNITESTSYLCDVSGDFKGIMSVCGLSRFLYGVLEIILLCFSYILDTHHQIVQATFPLVVFNFSIEYDFEVRLAKTTEQSSIEESM